MTQKYKDEVVYSPGTVIISAVGEVSDIRKIISPVLKDIAKTNLIYIDFSKDKYCLGGSSFAQLTGNPGDKTPMVNEALYFAKAFNAVQNTD